MLQNTSEAQVSGFYIIFFLIRGLDHAFSLAIYTWKKCSLVKTEVCWLNKFEIYHFLTNLSFGKYQTVEDVNDTFPSKVSKFI